MKKIMVAISLLVLSFSAFAEEKVATYTLPEIKALLAPSATWPEWNYIAVDDGEYVLPYEPEGAPLLPYRVLKFAVPDGYQVESVQSEGAEWTTLSEQARLIPIQPPIPTSATTAPAFVELDSKFAVDAPYPASPVEKLKAYTQGGINLLSVKVLPFRYNPVSGLLEQAKNLKIVVTFSPLSQPPASTSPSSPILREWARKGVVNPEDLPPEPMKSMAVDDTKPIYLIIAPHDLYNDWVWYADERAKNHPEINFDVIDTQTIYNEYPYRNVRQPTTGPITDLADTESRYPCESIYKWLVNYYS